MEIIKVSFDPTEAWNREEFRNLIKLIRTESMDGWILDEDNNRCGKTFEYELYIITSNTNSVYINVIAGQLDIIPERIIMCVDDDTKIEEIILTSDIHLDYNQIIITALENTAVKGILVDNKIAYQAIGLKYIQDLNKRTMEIVRERNN